MYQTLLFYSHFLLLSFLFLFHESIIICDYHLWVCACLHVHMCTYLQMVGLSGAGTELSWWHRQTQVLMSHWDRDPKEHSTYYPQVSHLITKCLD